MIRVFRADRPHDVAPACLVAAQDPTGHTDVLVLAADQTRADRSDFMRANREVGRGYPWAGVVEVPDIPLNRHWLFDNPRGSRIEMVRDLRESARMVRAAVTTCLTSQVGTAETLDAVEQVYVPSLSQPGSQLICHVCPRAEINCVPHGFDSFHEWEIALYEPYARGVGHPPRLRHRALRTLKRLRWGYDAALDSDFPVKRVYTFSLQPDWGCEVLDVSHLLDRGTMGELFGSLSQPVQRYFESMARGAGPEAALLIASPGQAVAGRSYEVELRGLVATAEGLARETGCQRIVIKPHPTSAKPWVEKIVSAVKAALPTVETLVIDRYELLPAEVVLYPFEFVGAAALGSSSGKTLAMIYGWPMYAQEKWLRDLYSYDASLAQSQERWIESHREWYTPL